jgi:hypothetical protein
MVYKLGRGVTNIYIDGFSDTVAYTSNRYQTHLQACVDQQVTWAKQFALERRLLDSAVLELTLSKKARSSNADEEEDQCNTVDDEDAVKNFVADLPNPVGWPLAMEGCKTYSGIPSFSFCVQVDVQGRFSMDCKMVNFVGAFGLLPAAAIFEMTKMVYGTQRRIYDPLKVCCNMSMAFVVYASQPHICGVCITTSHLWCTHLNLMHHTLFLFLPIDRTLPCGVCTTTSPTERLVFHCWAVCAYLTMGPNARKYRLRFSYQRIVSCLNTTEISNSSVLPIRWTHSAQPDISRYNIDNI